MSADRRVFVSWSGGKDSAYALHRAIRTGGVPDLLISMLVEDGGRSRSNGVRREVLAAQAAAVGVPLHCEATSRDDYETAFSRAVRTAVAGGVTTGVSVTSTSPVTVRGSSGWWAPPARARGSRSGSTIVAS